MLFQTCMTLFFKQNTKEDTLKNIGLCDHWHCTEEKKHSDISQKMFCYVPQKIDKEWHESESFVWTIPLKE